MGLTTTCIGAYPKPDYVPIRDWFQIDQGLTASGGLTTRLATEAMAQTGDPAIEARYRQATKAAIDDQIACGIDIPSDGEQRRENYIHYHCRHLHGFDFTNLTSRTLRDGAYTTELPTISGPVSAKDGHFLDADFTAAQSFTDRPVKITVPGPITITDTCANLHYAEPSRLAEDLAAALNHEIKALAAAGCQHIQVDEPLFARNPEAALDYGIACLERCFAGVPANVTKIVHLCCGYPEHLDDTEYHKADPAVYRRLAAALDASLIEQISIEDAHCHNDLSLLELWPNKTVIFGAVAIAQSRVETAAEIKGRLQAALNHIDRDRLIVAPDCGLAMLGRERAMAKLSAMCAAAKEV